MDKITNDKDKIIDRLISSEIMPLKSLAKVSEDAICAGATRNIRKKQGIFIIWWLEQAPPLLKSVKENPVISKYLNLLEEGRKKPHSPLPLILKHSPNLSQSISQQMKLGTSGRITEKLKGRKSLYPTHTLHNLRIGIEYIFPHKTEPKQWMLECTGVSYCLLEDFLINEGEGKKIEETLRNQLLINPI